MQRVRKKSSSTLDGVVDDESSKVNNDVSTWCSSAKRENINDPAFLFFHAVSLIHITRKSLEQQRSRILRKLISRFALERRYYENLEQMSFAKALFERSRSDKKVVMDLEDLSNFVLCNDEEEEESSFNQSCPYFSSQVLMGDAHLVVCPYNYILDPGIREAMGIDLNDSAVILDEAHNMSGVCRDSGSIEIKLQQLEMEQLCCVFGTFSSWVHDGKKVSDCARRWVKFLERVVVRMLQNDNEVPLPSRTNRYADPTEHAMSMFMSSPPPTTTSSSSSSMRRNMSAMNVRGNIDTLMCNLFGSVGAAQLEIEELRADACTMFDAVLEKGPKKW